MDPKVTVVIPCYNYGDLVEEAINSVLTQTYSNFELIVINDGSTDSSNKVISRLSKKHGFTYVNQKNAGLIATRNKGIELATGKYIIQLDADDTLPKNYLYELVNFAKKHPADIYYTPAVNLDSEELIVDPPEFDINILKIRNFIHATAMFKTSTVRKIKYDENLAKLGLEDWDLNLSICLSGGEAYLVKSTHLNYRRHGVIRSRSQLRRNSVKSIEAIMYIFSKHIANHSEAMRDLTWLNDNIKKIYNEYKSEESQNNNLHEALRELQARIDLMENSFSWRITKPIRQVRSKARQYVKRDESLGILVRNDLVQTKNKIKKALQKPLYRVSVNSSRRYINRYIQNNPDYHVVDANEPLQRSDFHTMVTQSVSLNETLIDWKQLKNKKRSNGVSIVVLVLNNPELTKRCIESIMTAENKTEAKLIVVDNGSRVETIRMLARMKKKYPQITLVFNTQNLNFSLGNNVGFSFVDTDKAIFINNDTYVTNGWIDALVLPLENEDIKAVQPTLLYPEGDIQCAGVVFSRKSNLGYGLYAGMPAIDGVTLKDRRVQAVTAACVAIRSEEFVAVEGFDVHFINGQEDIDLCKRLTKDGGVCYVTKNSTVYHDESRTPGRGRFTLDNRRQFVARWANKITPDDEAYYSVDGYRIIGWNTDSNQANVGNVAVYTPRLERNGGGN